MILNRQQKSCLKDMRIVETMSKNIKIAYCLVGLDGGVGNFILNYLDHFDLSDYEVRIIAHDCSSDIYRKEYEKRGFQVIKVRSKKESIINNLKDLYQAIDGCNVVHAHMTLTNVFPLFVAWLLGIKVRICHSHLAEKKTLKSRFLSFASMIFSTELCACGYKAGEYMYGKKDFKVIPNGIDLDTFCYNKRVHDEERKKYNINNDTFVIGNVGRFTYQKNQKFILEIFKKLQNILSDSKLIFIGEGEDYNSIKKLAKEYSIYENIIFLGAINDVANKLNLFDLFILPSRFEGLPISLLEAQAVGLPCIISDAISEEVLINDNVIRISLDESVDSWVQKILELKKVGKCKNNSKIIESGFEINDCAKKLDLYYRELLGGEK